MDFMVKHLTPERANDVLINDGLLRIVRAYKYHNPKVRPVLHRFIETVVDLTFEHLSVSQLINLCITDIMALQEMGMKSIMIKSDVLAGEGRMNEKQAMDVEMHAHIPFLVD